MALLRFHWDFFGSDALPTAEHFVKHLHEFCEREGVIEREAWVSNASGRCTAILQCDERFLKVVRDALRPVRGERVLS